MTKFATDKPQYTRPPVMCTEVYNIFSDIECRHKEYQNTFPCHVARRCHPDDDQLLKEPIFLPARPPNVPPGLFGCKVRRATRPIMGKCRSCSKKGPRPSQGNITNIVETTPSSTSRISLAGSAKSTASGFTTPSPDRRILLERVPESSLEVSGEQRTTPQRIYRAVSGKSNLLNKLRRGDNYNLAADL
ncbi:hypothetical protein GGS24DRAFT_238251 [Hypoxylon argillaceum]|nr:hypothetical protein GGS24DRAFT_238251 [Hypoxylon argillaceum]KAI1152996.1 hypothetical protein F4825DRAFT_475287 [Nemania diffusa]